MTLKGPPITRYNPCGLGIIHFQKITEHIWQGVIYLGLHKENYSEVDVEISFENRMMIYGVSQNTTFSVMNNGYDVIMKPKSDVPHPYTFYLTVIEEGTNKIPTVKKLSLNKVILCDGAIKGSQTAQKFNVTKEHDIKYHHVCGKRTMDHNELISVSTTAKTGEWPWHVAILLKEPTTKIDKYQCGGNIISTTAVLTAGHCVSQNSFIVDPWRITILAGISNLTDLKHLGRQVHNVVRVILHPAFNDMQATSDLAILKVRNFRFTEFVQPVCIWGPVYDKSSLFGKQATVVGFGKTEDNKLSDTLRSAYIMVQNDSTCIAYSPALYSGLLNEFTFCAGYGPSSGINPRNGDSGGGLMVATVLSDLRITWFLRGIVSKCGVSPGHTECDPKFYLVYTDVGPHYGWIYHNAGLEYRSNIMQ